MCSFRHQLPQLSDRPFITDGGLETTLIYKDGYDLPEFAAFVLLNDPDGLESLRNYFRSYLSVAEKHQLGFILDSPTYRASQDWADKLGISAKELDEFNQKGVSLLRELRKEFDDRIPEIVLSGCIGPQGDAYSAETGFTAQEAADYHRTQIASLRNAHVDMITAHSIPHAAEGLGIAIAAQLEDMPVAISFTIETDGRLPSGESLKYAIEMIDELTDFEPAYYMINCAHPTHIQEILTGNEPWMDRIKAIRANASNKSHAELDASTELDAGNPEEYGSEMSGLANLLNGLNIYGGCCGTDHRHVAATCEALQSAI